MLANMLDITVSIESRVATQGSNGAVVSTYTTKYASVAASFKEKQANIKDFGSQTPNYIYRFYLSYIADIIESDRILYNGEYYYIETVYNVAGKNRILQIEARKTE